MPSKAKGGVQGESAMTFDYRIKKETGHCRLD